MPSRSTRSPCPSGRSTSSDPSASLSTIMRGECATGVPVSIGRVTYDRRLRVAAPGVEPGSSSAI